MSFVVFTLQRNLLYSWIFQCCGILFMDDFEAFRLIRMEPEEFIEPRFKEEINLV